MGGGLFFPVLDYLPFGLAQSLLKCVAVSVQLAYLCVSKLNYMCPPFFLKQPYHDFLQVWHSEHKPADYRGMLLCMVYIIKTYLNFQSCCRIILI